MNTLYLKRHVLQMPSESDGGNGSTGTSGATSSARGGIGGGNIGGFNAAKDSQAANFGFGNENDYGNWTDAGNSGSLTSWGSRNPVLASIFGLVASLFGSAAAGLPGSITAKMAVNKIMSTPTLSDAQKKSASEAIGNLGEDAFGTGFSGFVSGQPTNVTDKALGGGNGGSNTNGVSSAQGTPSTAAATTATPGTPVTPAQTALSIANDGLNFTKQQYEDSKPYRDAAAATSQQAAEAALASQNQNNALAADYANYNKTTFRPLEQKIVADATGYDTPEKRQAAADAAMADTNMAFGAANKATAQQLAANGIDPGSTRAMSVMQGQGVNQATSNAGAAFNARKGVESVGHAMQMDAAGLGRGLPTAAAASSQAATYAGNSASGTSLNGLNAVNSGVGAVQSGYSAASNASLGLGNLYNNVAQTTNQANQTAANSSNALWGSLGQVAGSWAGSAAGSNAISAGLDWLSDENVKSDIKPMSDEEALSAMRETPVKKWKYSPSKLAANGIPMPAESAGENVGPMAQKVNETMGEEAAPGGKTLNPVTMNGIAMKSIQALDKRVTNLAKMIQGGKIKAGEKK